MVTAALSEIDRGALGMALNQRSLSSADFNHGGRTPELEVSQETLDNFGHTCAVLEKLRTGG